MRNHDNPHSGNKNLRLVVWFLFALFVVLAISLSIKVVAMLSSSIFDGKHRFTVFLSDANQNASIVSLEPQDRTVVLRLSGKPTKKQAESSLLVPFDGSIYAKNDSANENSVSGIISSFLFSSNAVYDSLTPYDLFRLYFLSIQNQKEDLINELVEITKGKTSIAASRKLFVDRGILSDNKVIAIVNSTGVSGLGQRFEQALISLGGDVVSVTTGRDLQEPTYIFYSGNKSYTVERIERIFHQQAEAGNTQAADILVVVGKRSLPLGIFATLEE